MLTQFRSFYSLCFKNINFVAVCISEVEVVTVLHNVWFSLLMCVYYYYYIINWQVILLLSIKIHDTHTHTHKLTVFFQDMAPCTANNFASVVAHCSIRKFPELNISEDTKYPVRTFVSFLSATLDLSCDFFRIPSSSSCVIMQASEATRADVYAPVVGCRNL